MNLLCPKQLKTLNHLWTVWNEAQLNYGIFIISASSKKAKIWLECIECALLFQIRVETPLSASLFVFWPPVNFTFWHHAGLQIKTGGKQLTSANLRRLKRGGKNCLNISTTYSLLNSYTACVAVNWSHLFLSFFLSMCFSPSKGGVG